MISELVKEAQGSALPQYAAVAQAVERFLGKEEVTSSILVNSSTDAGWWLATKRNSNNRSFNNHL